jgi:hypothetical protein
MPFKIPQPFALGPQRSPAGLALVVLTALTGCDVQVREGNIRVGVYSAEAKQEWRRAYALPAGGQVEIANLNGPVELTAGPAGALEVQVDISAKALTESIARDILGKGKIEETVSLERVKVETVVPRGVHGSYEARYQIRVPSGVTAQVSTTNGSLKATGLVDMLKASVVNGAVELTAISGGLDAAVVNGSLSVKLAKVTAAIRLETANGRIALELPKASRANLTARVVNGGLTVSGLPVKEPVQRRIRDLDTALNGGGPTIDLRTTNGRISITGTE